MKTLEEIKQCKRLLVGHAGLDGGYGEISIGGWIGSVIWSTGGGWEHVSVSPYKHRITPSWDDMCKLKEIFFGDDEWAVEYHPPKSEYVNNMPNCLHIWKPTKEQMPTPPSVMTGIKEGQSVKDFMEAIDEIGKDE